MQEFILGYNCKSGKMANTVTKWT